MFDDAQANVEELGSGTERAYEMVYRVMSQELEKRSERMQPSDQDLHDLREWCNQASQREADRRQRSE